MDAIFRHATGALVAALLMLLTGCSSSTTITSDLVLAGHSGASIQLHRQTRAIELHNDSNAEVRVWVLDKKERVVSNMLLSAQDQARLDLITARSIQFDNDSGVQAVVRWILRNDDRIEYSLAMTPTEH